MNLDTPEPKVSVILPVYNTGKALNGSVYSILAQTYKNLELILVDDGSTDESASLCDQFATVDDRVYVVHQGNSGVSSARNTGIAEATGEFLVFVDADDFLHPDALSTVMARILRDGSDIASFGFTSIYHEGERVVARRVKRVDRAMILESASSVREQFFDLFELGYWSSVWNKVFRTEFVRQSRIVFDDRMAVLEDFEFVVRALTHGPRISVLPEALYDYQIDVRARSASRRPDIDYLRNIKILEESLERLASAIGLSSPSHVDQLNALVFGFYLTGVQMILARAIGHRERHRDRYGDVRAYLADEQVFVAAISATASHGREAVMAKLVRRHRTLLAYAVTVTWHWVTTPSVHRAVVASKARITRRRRNRSPAGFDAEDG